MIYRIAKEIQLKFVIALIVLFTVAIDLLPQENKTGKLTVTVNNIRSDEGYVRISLFNSMATHLTKSFCKDKKPAHTPNCVFVFNQLPYGNYTLSIHHDENANGKMDKNLLGLPKEGYSFSNNAKVFLGPPSYEECLFTINKPEQILVVQFNY